jgi:hypothetical protein
MSKKPPSAAPPSATRSEETGGVKSIDVGDLTEAVTRSITRALGVRDAAKLPIRIICGIIAEPPDFFKGGGGGGLQQ